MAKAKQIAGIDCEGAALAGIHLVLVTRFREMCLLREKALDWNDPEGVHDMRVSSRRLRGAVRDFTPYLRKRGLAGVLRRMTAVADALGAVRDEDVAIIGLQKLAAGAPAEAAAVLEQLVRTRETIRKAARKDLRQALHKGQLKKLQKDFTTAIDSATASSKRTRKVRGSVSYREVGHRIILARLKEVEKLSDALYQPLRIKPLHKMRIAAKRLRYAIELFQPCWGQPISIFAKRVAILQTSLGELHDSDIWIETFGEHLNGVEKEPKERAAAALWLLNHFVRLHSKHLRNTLSHWRDWEANDIGSCLRDCLNRNAPQLAKPMKRPPARRK